MPRNIEIKARINSVEALLTAARTLARSEPAVIEQDDTFFTVPHGRLKLREFADGSAELIHYHRPDSGEAKASDYVRVAVPDAAALREALQRACGLLGRVRKTRLLVLVDEAGFSTRIHIDRVRGLGEFMELEVVLKPGQSDSEGTAVAQALMSRLDLADAPRLAGSYLDLMGR
ncbi:MAG: class IV adenylate cyclase [Rubrivivax sp.]|nr:class IV adenylate cyclase [Rubrivivax sp.]